MEKSYKITVGDVTKEYPSGTRIIDIAREFQKPEDYPIIISEYNNSLKELNSPLVEDGIIKFYTTSNKNGRKTYRRSVVLLLQKAVYDLFGSFEYDVHVLRSIDNGYFCQLVRQGSEDEEKTIVEASDEFVDKVERRMHELVEENLPIEKVVMKTKKAMKIFHDLHMYEKESLLRYRTSSNINVYRLGECYDYFYGYMAPSTGYLEVFRIEKFQDGFVVQFPGRFTSEIRPFNPSMKLCRELNLTSEWSLRIGINSVAALNDSIVNGRGRDVILINEAFMEKQISDIARAIYENRSKKFIMIAGPSSSGKTTFSHKLSTVLRGLGLCPHPIPLDDYYVDRDKIPLDEFGEKDFEAVEGIDIELFNKDMLSLLKGERVLLPTFNFKTGKREYNNKYMQLGEDDVLVIEGIHGLNDRLSHSLPRENKYKIYISALTQLSIDEHNPLSTADARLIRRIVRDSRSRGTSAQGTLAMWDSVRRGETKNIFTFQEDADFIINSALIYELSVLKVYALPQLYAVDPSSPEYIEAHRLIKLLEYFMPLPSDDVPNTSIIREFIGGGVYRV
ncbi:MAG TPA: nucleoside kinase [Lachnospiraceae bacterium]|nr:nucleoside kinase [Lachnospiraceae bacterium]